MVIIMAANTEKGEKMAAIMPNIIKIAPNIKSKLNIPPIKALRLCDNALIVNPLNVAKDVVSSKISYQDLYLGEIGFFRNLIKILMKRRSSSPSVIIIRKIIMPTAIRKAPSGGKKNPSTIKIPITRRIIPNISKIVSQGISNPSSGLFSPDPPSSLPPSSFPGPKPLPLFPPLDPPLFVPEPEPVPVEPPVELLPDPELPLFPLPVPLPPLLVVVVVAAFTMGFPLFVPVPGFVPGLFGVPGLLDRNMV